MRTPTTPATPFYGALALFFCQRQIVVRCGVTLRGRLAARDSLLAIAGVVGLFVPDALRRRHFFWTFSSSALEAVAAKAAFVLFLLPYSFLS